jgi:hypothetical protein
MMPTRGGAQLDAAAVRRSSKRRAKPESRRTSTQGAGVATGRTPLCAMGAGHRRRTRVASKVTMREASRHAPSLLDGRLDHVARLCSPTRGRRWRGGWKPVGDDWRSRRRSGDDGWRRRGRRHRERRWRSRRPSLAARAPMRPGARRSVRARLPRGALQSILSDSVHLHSPARWGKTTQRACPTPVETGLGRGLLGVRGRAASVPLRVSRRVCPSARCRGPRLQRLHR